MNKQTSKTYRKLTGSASFVFRGIVRAIGDSNLEGVEPDERMITMRVDEVIVAPRDLGELKGKVLTVYMQSTRGIRKGQQLIVFATSWHYGKNIGVIELGRTVSDIKEVRAMTINERIRQLDEELEERIRLAKIIISGGIITTSRVQNTINFPGIEEGVEWWQAETWIKTVEKGQVRTELKIFYPVGGEDPRLGGYPKCYPGQEGIWFLRPVADMAIFEEKSTNTRRKTIKYNGNEPLMTHDILDFHALSSLQRIQSLLWRVEKEQVT